MPPKPLRFDSNDFTVFNPDLEPKFRKNNKAIVAELERRLPAHFLGLKKAYPDRRRVLRSATEDRASRAMKHLKHVHHHQTARERHKARTAHWEHAALEDALGDELRFVGVGGGGGGGGGGDGAGADDDDDSDVSEEDGGDERELVPGGRHIRVTEANKEEYASLLVEDYLVGAAREGIAALLKGAHDVLPRRVLHAEGLRAIDLELLVGGLPCIDVDDCGTLAC